VIHVLASLKPFRSVRSLFSLIATTETDIGDGDRSVISTITNLSQAELTAPSSSGAEFGEPSTQPEHPEASLNVKTRKTHQIAVVPCNSTANQ